MLLIATALAGPLTFVVVVALRQQRLARRVIAGALVAGALLSAVLAGPLSAAGAPDTVARCLVVVLTALVARAVPERPLLALAAAATALAAAGPGGPVAAMGLGLAGAEYGHRRAALWKRQAIGAGIGAGATGLPSFMPATSLVGAAMVGAVLVCGLFGASAAQRRRAVRGTAVAGGVALVLVVVAAIRLRSVPSDLSGGQVAIQATVEGLRGADTAGAGAQLDQARASFSRAGEALGSPLVAPLRVLPVVGRHVELGRDLTGSATEITERARAVVDEGNIAVLVPKEGRVDLAAVRALTPDIEAAAVSVSAARLVVERAQDHWLAPPVRTRLDRLDDSLDEGGGQLDALAVTLRVLPGLLGETGTRRAFAGFTTPSEVRGLGGIVGNFAELEANGGKLKLVRTGRDSDLNREGKPTDKRTLEAPAGYLQTWAGYGAGVLWQNVTLSPDGPSVAQAVAGLYPQSGGRPVDVVAMVDTNGLAALLELTGPVTVRSWPEPLTAANATNILGIEQYKRYPDNDRRTAFLEELTTTTFERLLTIDPKRLQLAASCLGRAVQDRHIVLWSARPEEQLAFERLGITGALPQPTAEEEVAGVVLNNAAGNKLDWFTGHTTKVTRSFDPETGDRLAVVTTTITNDAPRSGLPAYVANSFDAGPGAQPGDHRLLVSAYGTGTVDSVQVAGRSAPVIMSRETELDVATADVQIPAGASREVTFTFRSKSDGRIPRRLTLIPDQRPANEALCS